MTSPRVRLALGTFWSASGVAVQLLFGMLASIIAARILGPSHFGALGVARTTLMFVVTLAGVNIGAATSRAVADLRHADPDRAGRVIGLLLNTTYIASGAATLLCLALASPIAQQLGASGLALPVAISALAIVFIAAGSVLTGALQGFEAFARAARLIAIEGMLVSTLLVGGAWLAGVAGAMAGMSVATMIGFILKRHALLDACRRRDVTIHHRGVMAEMPIVWTLLVPVVLNGLAMQLFEWLARLMLARGPNGLAQAGVFAAANAWGMAVLMIPTQVAKPAMPILTNLLAAGDDRGFRRLLRDTLLTTFTFALLAAAPLALLAPWIMRAYGASFEGAANVLRVIVLSSVVSSIWWSFRSALFATGKLWKQAFQAIVWGIVLMFTFYVTRERGAMALASAYVVAYVVAAGVQAVMTRSAIRESRGAPPHADEERLGVELA